ncbi:hypothetical protein CHS0354_001263 [Potamilus streckersoni]|uniref:Zinc transporter ZIP3 n=1 Tax=Potamilus streckersoni TaxID=2493646 RepID=A0AAE0S7C9_9BIVA|nr:hypothetical protein CHS0354_001263 [Potamilus streckersoni]
MSQTLTKEVDMDVVVAKILSLLIITTLTVLLGLVPYRLLKHCGTIMMKWRRSFDYILSGVRCFSGGVFLGTCFLHLMPETRNKVDELLEQIGSRSKYPVAELMTIVGFFGVIFGEHAIRILYYKFHEDTCCPSERDIESYDHDYIPTTEDRELSGLPAYDIECQSLSSLSNNDIHTETYRERTDNYRNEQDREETEQKFEMDMEPAPLQEVEVKTMVTELSRGEDSRSQIRSVLYLTALSFHGVFEGMALGLQSLEEDVWVLCVAISIHRGILSFGMGLQHSKNNERPASIVFIISSFSIICALGIIIGTAISTGAQLYSDVNVPNAILQSLATGTIFYIVFFNVLFKELDGNKDVKKISCTFVGFAFMAVIFAVAHH